MHALEVLMNKKINLKNYFNKMKNKIKSILIKMLFVTVVIIIIYSLLFVNIKDVLLNVPLLLMLNINLKFIQGELKQFSLIIIIGIIALGSIVGYKKFFISEPKITIAGIEFKLKNSERIVKTNVKNFLSTKRSLFVFDIKHDNFYDVINSYYDIYKYLREQIGYFEDTMLSEGECYKKIESLLVKINSFLTKYQSNYKRWYIKEVEGDFRPFMKIQETYEEYELMKQDFLKLNEDVIGEAIFFGIDIKKWKM